MAPYLRTSIFFSIFQGLHLTVAIICLFSSNSAFNLSNSSSSISSSSSLKTKNKQKKTSFSKVKFCLTSKLKECYEILRWSMYSNLTIYGMCWDPQALVLVSEQWCRISGNITLNNSVYILKYWNHFMSTVSNSQN